MPEPSFTKTIVGTLVNNVHPEPMNLLLAAGDMNGDGLPDFVLSGRNGKMIWLENRGQDAKWVEHVVDDAVEKMERGGCLYDLTGTGTLDIVNGGDWRSDELCWWENPGVPGVRWNKRVIAKTGRQQFHDVIAGDVTGDGVTSLVFTNQIGGTDIYRVPIPPDPRVSPWPNIETIATGKGEPNPFTPGGVQPEEGLAIADLDGDGKPELVCGTHWYKRVGGRWQAHRFASGYIVTKVAVGDLDGDGRNEIVLSEGDPFVYGKMEGGKLAWFQPDKDVTGPWIEHVLADGLFDAHTLELGDVLGNGHLDILLGEVGIPRSVLNRPGRLKSLLTRYLNVDAAATTEYVRVPRILLFENDGTARFTKHTVDVGTGIHDGILVDTRNRGVLDIVGKPLYGPERWNVHVWVNQRVKKSGNHR
jgi:hypothetical protein